MDHDPITRQAQTTTRGLRRASTRRWTAAGAALVVAGCASVLGPLPSAHAAPFTVSTTADSGPGSLRAAIAAANASPGFDEIQLAPGTYELSILPSGGNDNTSGDLNVTGPLSIVGTGGAGVTTIDAKGIDRAFQVDGALQLTGLTIRNGQPENGQGFGGNVYVTQWGSLDIRDSVVRDGYALHGGGMAAYGYVEMMRTSVVDNRAVAIPGNDSTGGGVFIGSNASIESSLVAGNTATNGHGGGIVLNPQAKGIVSMFNSTVTRNDAYSGGGVSSSGGGEVVLSHLTVAQNTTDASSGTAALDVTGTTAVTIDRSILAGNTAGGSHHECSTISGGTITSAGSNLADDATCTTFTAAGDTTNDNGAALQNLASNGGPTETMALGAGSTAIDAATCGIVNLDQRGLPRPAGASCDKGAFEDQGSTPGSTVPPTTTPPTTAAPTTTAASASSSTTAATHEPSKPLVAAVLGATATPAQDVDATSTDEAVPASAQLPETGTDHALPLGLLGAALVTVGVYCLRLARRVDAATR